MRAGRWKGWLLACACLAAGVVFGWSGVGEQFGAYAYDFLLRLRPAQPRPDSAIVLALDERTLQRRGSLAHLRQPLCEALEVLRDAGAKAVVLDIQLADLYDEQWDRRLSEALDATPNLVLSSNLVDDRGRVAWEDPRPEFSRHAVLGHVHSDPDPDAVSRQVLLYKAAAGRRRWALALEAFRVAAGAPNIVETDETIEVGNLSIPVPRREQRALRIRYRAKGAIERIPMIDLIGDKTLAARLRNRVVFIGVTVQGGPDRLMTPYSDGEAMPGVVIHGHIFETLAAGKFLRSVSDLTTLGFTTLLVVALAICFQQLAGLRAFGAGFGLLALAHLVPAVLFFRDWVMPASPAAASAWFCFLALGTRHYLTTRKRLGVAEAQRDRYQQAVHYVTHEMRTPLTAIQGSSELIGRYALNEEKRKEIAGLIHRESRRLARMVEMFLSVERLSAGQLELKREAVSASEILTTCLERARPLAERKEITLKCAPAADEEAILGDREFLEYACYNLITNSVKYSPPKTEIVAGVERSGGSVRLTVQDQGYGMDEQEVKRIFQKFYRTRRAQDSGETGTGIGLALVEEIVVQHGGSIEVESRVNHGSRFTLVLPRAGDRVAQTTH